MLHFVHFPVREELSQLHVKQLALILVHKEHCKLLAVVKFVN